jgi:hypothetical protein
MMPANGNVPYRGRAALAAVFGSLAGIAAKLAYDTAIAPRLFPPLQPPAGAAAAEPGPLERSALGEPLYRPDETMYETTARVGSALLTGRIPEGREQRRTLGLLVQFAYLLAAGVGYGATRSTTRWRDFAGAFFMAFRMHLGEAVLGTWLGLRPGPGRYSTAQLLGAQTSYWVYTFVMATVTRVLYRLVSGRDYAQR